MRIFKITPQIEIVCNSERTRYGFRHLATLFINGREEETDKCCYYNRTWERYEFQSVILKVIEKSTSLSDKEKELCKEWAEGDHTDWSNFKMVSQIAKLGEVFCDNQKDKNNWKERMLRAGFEKKGLDIPDDWDKLSENEKEKRLNNVIECMGEH